MYIFFKRGTYVTVIFFKKNKAIYFNEALLLFFEALIGIR